MVSTPIGTESILILKKMEYANRKAEKTNNDAKITALTFLLIMFILKK